MGVVPVFVFTLKVPVVELYETMAQPDFSVVAVWFGACFSQGPCVVEFLVVSAVIDVGYVPVAICALYASRAVWVVFTVDLQDASAAFLVVVPTAKITIVARIARMMITMRSSMRVKPSSFLLAFNLSNVANTSVLLRDVVEPRRAPG
jgi:hypothetical protein